jgi:hypothetical protein
MILSRKNPFRTFCFLVKRIFCSFDDVFLSINIQFPNQQTIINKWPFRGLFPLCTGVTRYTRQNETKYRSFEQNKFPYKKIKNIEKLRMCPKKIAKSPLKSPRGARSEPVIISAIEMEAPNHKVK